MSNNLGSNVNVFLGLQCQFKILHWQTKGYARHVAFGNIYDTLDGLIDQYVEISMGKFGRFSIDESSRNIEIYNLLDIEITNISEQVKPTTEFWKENVMKNYDLISASLPKHSIDNFLISCDLLSKYYSEGAWGYGIIKGRKK